MQRWSFPLNMMLVSMERPYKQIKCLSQIHVHILPLTFDLLVHFYCESIIVHRVPVSWFSCVGQTMKFGSEQKGDSH